MNWRSKKNRQCNQQLWWVQESVCVWGEPPFKKPIEEKINNNNKAIDYYCCLCFAIKLLILWLNINNICMAGNQNFMWDGIVCKVINTFVLTVEREVKEESLIKFVKQIQNGRFKGRSRYFFTMS